MQFCDACGSMMHADGDVMICRNEDCEQIQEKDAEVAASFVSTSAQDESDVIESSPDADFEGKPTSEVHCESCGNDEAWYTIKQTGSADEPPTRFFKCTDCGSRWREYA